MTEREQLLREAVAALRNVTAVMQRLLDEPSGQALEAHYTVREVATLLKVSVNAVGNEIRSGALRAVRIGRGKKSMYRVAASALAAFEKKRRAA